MNCPAWSWHYTHTPTQMVSTNHSQDLIPLQSTDTIWVLKRRAQDIQGGDLGTCHGPLSRQAPEELGGQPWRNVQVGADQVMTFRLSTCTYTPPDRHSLPICCQYFYLISLDFSSEVFFTLSG